MRTKPYPWAIVLLCAALLVPVRCLAAERPAGLLKRLGKSDAVLVRDSAGRTVYSVNADRPRVPASTLKIFTALFAFHQLGQEYRFPTVFHMDEGGNLLVQGYGDPLLVSETLAAVAAELSGKLTSVHHILVDDAYFTDPLAIPGVNRSTEPYDAPNGALCANFNTVAFRSKDGAMTSGEPQTPLLPFAVERIRATGLRSGRITLVHDHREAARYTGLLLAYFLSQAGVPVNGGVENADPTPSTLQPLIHTHWTPHPLSEVVKMMLNSSSNFMANQLFLAAGARALGPPGSLDKAVRAAKTFAAEMLKIEDLDIREGSGISRQNRLSALDMSRIVEAFRPHRHLLRRQGRDLYKTGTLNGVRTRAGFIEGSSGQIYTYAVLVNTPGRSTAPVMAYLLKNLP